MNLNGRCPYLFIAVFIILMPAISLAGTINLPRTGQDTCYDTDGILIDCTDTKQDGEIQAGVEWPDPRFTDNGDSTMTDNLTGLVWTQDANVAGYKTWQEAFDYIAGMNAGTYPNFGHTDWRLPNILELLSLSNLGDVSDNDHTFAQWLIDQGFTNVSVVGDIYWSSTTLVGYPTIDFFTDKAYTFNTLSVHTWTFEKSGTSCCWPVRAGQQDLPDPIYPANPRKTGQTICYDTDGDVIDCTGTGQDGDLQWGVAWPDPRITDNGDGTVTDNLTGLTLLKDVNALGETTWQEALDYIAGMNAGTYSNSGRTDWRLANFNEASSIIDFEGTYGFWLPSGPYTVLNYPWMVWTSTTFASTIFSGGDFALTMALWRFLYGFMNEQPKDGSFGGNGLMAVSDTGAATTTANLDSAGTNLHPINTFTGELFDSYSPGLNPGGPMPLFFSRYYASGLKDDGVTGNMGDNWLHNFEWTMTLSGTNATIISNKGRKITFFNNGASWNLTGKTDVPFQLVTSGSDFVIYEPDTEHLYTFDSTGKLTKIEDGRGNTHTLTYSGSDLTQVSDGLGRTLTFTYSSGKLSTVFDGTRTVSFTYTSNDLTQVTDALGNNTTYTYATGGLMTSWTLPEENTPYSQTYNGSGQADSQTDSDGNTTTLTYAAPDTTITDALGNSRKHTHTATGELSNSQDNAGQDIVIGSDATGRRSSITDRLGDVTTMIYHAPSGKLASRTNADGTAISLSYTARAIGGNTAYDLTGITHADATTESFTYDTSGNPTSHTDQAGNVSTSTYDANGQPLTITNKAGGISTMTYNADETTATNTDPAGNTTTFGYDTLKRTNLITRADSNTVDFTYDNADHLLTTTDENSNTTTLNYDLNGNLASVEDPLLNTVTFAYDGNDRLLSMTDPLTGVSSRTYDQLGRVGTSTDPLLNVTTYGYDIHNRLTSVTDPLANVWGTSYDIEGIISSTTDPLSNTTSFVSDNMGRITEATSPLGVISSISYDAMGRVSTVTDPLGNTTTFNRDTRGLLSGIELPGGSISTGYTRNALGQMTAVTDPNTNDWLRAYDTGGRMTSVTDPLGRTQTITYDTRNRLSTVTYPGGLGSVTMSYDAAGNLTGHVFSDGTTTSYTYDANNRRIAATGITRAYDANGRISSSNSIAITRDLNGNITSMTLAPDKVVTYAYDANDNLISVTDWAGGITGFTYDNAGRLTDITRPNGVDTTNTWDNDSRLTGIAESGVSSIILTRDSNGQIKSATRNVPQAASATPMISSSDTFDAASQIIGATYDAVGRMTGNGTDTFTWNLASLLTGYTVDGTTVTATYDAESRRISRTAGGVTRDYVWNDALGLSSISVEKQGGADLKYYIHTPGGALLYSMDATTNARNVNHYDEMGNAIFVTNDAGAVIGSYAYSPYGQVIASSGSLDNPFTWQGKYGIMDEGNGLYYIRARYYDSSTGRFINRDPVKSTTPKEVNPYQYALANPLRFVDVTGKEPTSVEQAEIDLAIAEAALAAVNAGYESGADDVAATRADYDDAYDDVRVACNTVAVARAAVVDAARAALVVGGAALDYLDGLDDVDLTIFVGNVLIIIDDSGSSINEVESAVPDLFPNPPPHRWGEAPAWVTNPEGYNKRVANPQSDYITWTKNGYQELLPWLDRRESNEDPTNPDKVDIKRWGQYKRWGQFFIFDK